MDPWGEIKADREVFADYLATLSPEDWGTRSLCDEWTVKGVATHLLVTPTMSKGQVFRAFLASGFNLDKMSAKLVRRMTTDMTTDEIVAQTRATAGARSAPPGLKPMGVFGEVLTHTTDISEVVGKPLAFPVAHYVAVLEYMKDVQPVLHCRKRIEGLRMQATDADWSTGSGPLVEGDAPHLLLAMTGRKSVLDGLHGEGVEILRSR